MKTSFKRIIFILIVTFTMNFSFAQQGLHIKLYKGTVYNSIPNSFKEIEMENGRITHVTDPELIAFFPQKQDSAQTAIIICPGGGYARLAISHEGYELAIALNDLGITAFILKYRLPNDTIMTDKAFVPLADAQQAIHLIRQNAAEWKINPAKVGILGFSAGGHLAASLSTVYNQDLHQYKDSISLRPDFSVLIYPVISLRESVGHTGSSNRLLGKQPSEEMLHLFSCDEQVNAATPPTLILLAADDKTVQPANSKMYYDALIKNKVPAELHLFQNGGHGFGLHLPGNYTWLDILKRWVGVNKF